MGVDVTLVAEAVDLLILTLCLMTGYAEDVVMNAS